ncbi:MAG: SMC-Scp complex subunit ScpB [Verrucomicrobiota bacterium]
MTRELENIVESIIFASPEGASTREITRCLRGAVATAREKDGELALEAVTRFAKVDETQVQAAIAHLNAVYEETGRAFLLVERPAGWRIMSRADFGPWVRELFPDKKPSRLTPSALETLAIIAYRQPVTKGSIEAVRGVSVDGPLQALLDRNVVRIAGRADLPGRPLLYETTDLFLDHFGIKTVDELPNAAELRSVKLPEPEPLTPPEAAVPQPELPLAAEAAGEESSAAAAGEAKPKRRGRKAKGLEAMTEGLAMAEEAVVMERLAEAGMKEAAPEAENLEIKDGEGAAENPEIKEEKTTAGNLRDREITKRGEEEPANPEEKWVSVAPDAEWSPAEDEPEPGPESESEEAEDAEGD